MAGFCVLATFLWVSVSAASADPCPNSAFRTGASANLPDCRAYEQVSPADKNGTDIVNIGGNEAAPTGDRIAYASVNAFGDAKGSGVVSHLRAIRDSDGWSARTISPPLPAGSIFTNSGAFLSSQLSAVSEDLSSAVWQTPPDPPTLPGTQEGASNFYRELEMPDGSYELMNPPFPDVGGSSVLVEVTGISADLSHVLLQAFGSEPLTPDTPPLEPGQFESYDWSAGQLHLVGILPDETVAPDGAETARVGAMSSDGSRIFFTSGGLERTLYVRLNDASTTLIANLGTNGVFEGATPDGSYAFYRDNSGELFAFNVDSEQATAIDHIGTGPGAGVVGFGDDGGYVYFGTETGDLDVLHGGTVTLIASNIESANLGQNAGTSNVSPNGRYLVFTTGRQLTAYDNTGHQEIYRYDAQAASLDCVSCDPNGAPATGDAQLHSFVETFSTLLPSAVIYRIRNVVDSGRVFFESPDALVPADTNGAGGCPIETSGFSAATRTCQDVYEWEGGQPRLISSGQADTPSSFNDASPSGNDVFFGTRQQLVRADTDNNIDLYDARVGGGFVESPPPSPPCSGEGCKSSPSSTPPEVTLGSAAFAGPGNSPHKRGHHKRRRHGRHKRNHHRANSDRGGRK
ncbi:MAG TPA: hypothetical protein VFJ64_10960 [Solirubrobacterales bacterium]|nr:hypothetical protein [Solirubrobacterales bacterium]